MMALIQANKVSEVEESLAVYTATDIVILVFYNVWAAT